METKITARLKTPQEIYNFNSSVTSFTIHYPLLNSEIYTNGLFELATKKHFIELKMSPHDYGKYITVIDDKNFHLSDNWLKDIQETPNWELLDGTKEDILVYCWNNFKIPNKSLRYYYKFENNMHVCFNDGQTRFTTFSTSEWENCTLVSQKDLEDIIKSNRFKVKIKYNDPHNTY